MLKWWNYPKPEPKRLSDEERNRYEEYLRQAKEYAEDHPDD